MVYCGKPSKGCGECRSRKIRCDQARPACSQCTKASRTCSGYRDQLSLMFRDESQQVVRKAKSNAPTRRAAKVTKRANVHASTPSPREKTASPSGDDKSLQSLQGTPSSEDSVSDLTVPSDSSPDRQALAARPVRDKQMQQQRDQPVVNVQPSYYPTQDEAVCYFLRYNAWPGAFWMLNATPDIFTHESGGTSLQAMKAGVVSVGTAMLSRIRRSPALKLAAEKEYGNALRLMNTAVSDAREARANPTLAAVLLLAIFEVGSSIHYGTFPVLNANKMEFAGHNQSGSTEYRKLDQSYPWCFGIAGITGDGATSGFGRSSTIRPAEVSDCMSYSGCCSCMFVSFTDASR